MPINALGGAHLNAVQSGTGQPVVALHGFTGSTTTWGRFIAAGRGKYTVVAVDLLGHGESDAPDNPECYTFDKFIQGLEELLDHLGVHRVCWLGYSLGGRVALSASISLPHRTAALVLESASPGLPTADERVARVQSDERLANWIEDVGVETFVEYWEKLPMWASQLRLPELVRRGLRSQRLTNHPLGLANSLKGMGSGAQPALHQRLGEITAPTLILAGEEDAKFATIAWEMHQAIPGSRLEIVERAGHTVHLEQPERFNRVVLEFLSSSAETSLNTCESRQAGSPQSR
ncbi:MAG: 2-succinyl-6-hydroxy-2,4-cyclohexadiene-1-carboxylate synthase [Chloroflexi bacterium]|nr:2-succinyl-6-hydroxy-2,4-cyclohexadiene-1-carboxylate synthase [Chloroflexota bacterium]